MYYLFIRSFSFLYFFLSFLTLINREELKQNGGSLKEKAVKDRFVGSLFSNIPIFRFFSIFFSVFCAPFLLLFTPLSFSLEYLKRFQCTTRRLVRKQTCWIRQTEYFFIFSFLFTIFPSSFSHPLFPSLCFPPQAPLHDYRKERRF